MKCRRKNDTSQNRSDTGDRRSFESVCLVVKKRFFERYKTVLGCQRIKSSVIEFAGEGLFCYSARKESHDLTPGLAKVAEW